MNRREFIRTYHKETGVSEMFRRRLYVVEPCHCGQPYCNGWAMVNNNEQAIANHRFLFVNDPEGELEGLERLPEIAGLGPEIEGL